MMNETRHALGQQAFWFLAIFAALVLVGNHVMLTWDFEAMRTWFYIVAVFVPLALVGNYRDLRRIHRGELERAREGLWLFGFAAAIAGSLWLVSTLFYGAAPEPLAADPELQRLIEKYAPEGQ